MRRKLDTLAAWIRTAAAVFACASALVGCAKSYVMHVSESYQVTVEARDASTGAPIDGGVARLGDERTALRLQGPVNALGEALLRDGYGGCHRHDLFHPCRVYYPNELRVEVERPGYRTGRATVATAGLRPTLSTGRGGEYEVRVEVKMEKE
ncbi:MAG: hypothetical protein HYZ53_30860 [Planctomycetes bacterium]|nr:hypothetical protein [Planctomycetota bacterium]